MLININLLTLKFSTHDVYRDLKMMIFTYSLFINKYVELKLKPCHHVKLL